jgi:hypothetical protein
MEALGYWHAEIICVSISRYISDNTTGIEKPMGAAVILRRRLKPAVVCGFGRALR